MVSTLAFPKDQVGKQAGEEGKKRSREEEEEEEANTCKRIKLGGTAVAKEWLCPITRDLPVDPVTAEDGKIYERSAILGHFNKNKIGRLDGGFGFVRRYNFPTFFGLIAGFSVGWGGGRLIVGPPVPRPGKDGEIRVFSPMTSEIIGTKLLPAPHIRNAIEHLIDSQIISGEVAKNWIKGNERKKTVEEYTKRANEGDSSVMWDVGQWHFHGKECFYLDRYEGFKWFKRAADLGDVRGMASAGSCLVEGWGCEKNICHGMMLTGIAAGLGSDMAAWNMGCWYQFGHGDLAEDRTQAKHWYRRMVDGSSCPIKHVDEFYIRLAKKRLEKLENTGSTA